jgi:hypothetical protein
MTRLRPVSTTTGTSGWSSWNSRPFWVTRNIRSAVPTCTRRAPPRDGSDGGDGSADVAFPVTTTSSPSMVHAPSGVAMPALASRRPVVAPVTNSRAMGRKSRSSATSPSSSPSGRRWTAVMPSCRAARTWPLCSVTNRTSSKASVGSAFATAARNIAAAGLRTPTSVESVTRRDSGSKKRRMPRPSSRAWYSATMAGTSDGWTGM